MRPNALFLAHPLDRAQKRWAPALCLLLIAGLAAGPGAGLVSPRNALAAAPRAVADGVEFSYDAPGAAAVFLAGDFNGWNATALALSRGDDGLWAATVELKPGSYEYKFIVDGVWVADPDNPQKKADPYGGVNSVVTLGPDGALVGSPAAAAPQPASAAPSGTAGKVPASFTVGPPAAVKDGILFTYEDPGAGAVFLAGSFNGWNASQLPLQNDGDGNWSVVQKLEAGRHEYKFVVDGNWLADPKNPDTQADPYGGVNSLVAVDAKGQVIAAAAAASPGSPGAAAGPTSATLALNTKVTLGGRYLTRFELAKNVLDDPRYRLLRPSQSVDLNFQVKVNDLTDALMRIRMDSNENVILNNIAGNLDEAQLFVHPDKFTVTAYWNREIFNSPDPLRLVGDLDHPATIGHDHLPMGKGTAGALVEADPFGVHFEGFFANVHNFDYYNDPALFDNTGGDRIWARLSRQVGPVTVGVPLWLQRELIWMNFETLVGQPSTGIPALDEYLDRTGDSSTWFETEAHDFEFGLDATLPLRDDTLTLAGQAMYVDLLGRMVTGNQSGQGNVNGAIDVPFLERQETLAGLRADWRPDPQTQLRLQHTYRDMRGSSPEQRTFALAFMDQTLASGHIFFLIMDSPAQTTLNWTELEGSWRSGDRDLRLYLWHAGLRENFGAAGRTLPEDSTRTDHTVGTWYLSGLAGKGAPRDRFGHAELEFGVTLQDPDLADQDWRTYELIGRYERDLSPSVAVLADVRFIRYDLDLLETDSLDPPTTRLVGRRESYWSPFLGLRYRPLRNLDLVVGYGLDPVEFSIDYAGRQFGRWWYRQNYLFDNPDADVLDAERHLADARIFTLRAQMTF